MIPPRFLLNPLVMFSQQAMLLAGSLLLQTAGIAATLQEPLPMSATALDMRRVGQAMLLAVALMATAFAARPRPTVLTSRLGSFHVVLPAGFPPPHRTQMNVGRLPVVTYASDSGRSAVVVRFVEYPQAPARADALLTQAQTTSLHNIGARLLASQRRRVDGHPGRSALFAVTSSGKPLFGRVDYLLAGRRLYQVEYVTPSRSNLNLASTRHYFESFTLLQ